MLTEITPISLPAVINRLQGEIIGRFSYELKKHEIRSAQFVLMDIHWYSSMAPAISLSKKIRRLNPGAVIIAGGITATLFARQLLRDSAIDYIIRGDADRPTADLVEALVKGKDPKTVANVVGRTFISCRRYALTSEDFDAGDYRDLSFFPTLQRRVFRLHAQARGKPFPVYPFLMAFRGCPFACAECCGSIDLQKRLFKRSWVVRSARRLREDLEYWESDARVSFVNIYHDFATLMPEAYTRSILYKRYRLSVFYDFFRCPSREQLDFVLQAFEGGILHFGLDQYHGNSKKMAPIDALADRLATAMESGRYNVRLTFNRNFIKKDPEYAAALDTVVRRTGVWTYNGDFWWEDNPIPDGNGWGTESDYRRCLKDRGRRYLLWNTIYRTGTLVYRYSPRLANIGARMWFRL